MSASARVAPNRESAARSADPNAEALDRICGSEPVLVDVRPAGEVVPGMTGATILKSGAPLPWAEYTRP